MSPLTNVPTPDDTTAAVAVLDARMDIMCRTLGEFRDEMRSDIAEMRKEFRTHAANVVSRSEYAARCQNTDDRFDRLEKAFAAKHTPWPVVATAICAAIALGLSIYT